MSHPCGMQWSAPTTGKFLERASDEILCLCSCDRSRRRKISKSKRASPVLAPVPACYASVPGPVIHLLVFRETPILSVFSGDRISNSLLFTGRGENIGGCKLQLCFCELNGCEAHRRKSARRQKSACIHPPTRAASFSVLPKRTQRT